MKMKAVLFDLDGTLLPLDIEKFMKLYFYEMSKAFEGILDMDMLVEKVMAATKVMVSDTTDMTNEEVFMNAYGHLISEDITLHQERWANFYEDGYKKVKASSGLSKEMISSVHMLKEKGYRVILVTNPLFPQVAIEERIKWAGLEPDDFDYVTSFERNHFCKPQIQLYEEVLRHNKLEAKECLMVGNDVQEDMVVSKLGMETYLIEDYLLHRTDELIETTYKGDMKSFFEFVKTVKEYKE